jgi:acetyl/propionyl-CoA carboxylase alpha subunit
LHLNFRADDEDASVEVHPDGQDWQLKIDGQTVPLQAVPDRDGAWLVETHQGRRRLWVAVRGDERLIFCDGKVHTLRLPDPEHADDDDQPNGGPNLKADMPGKVVQVMVEVGQEVAAGQALVIVESMKMETELCAAVAGTVATVHVIDGQVVGQGDLLVDIAEDITEAP